MAEAAPAAPADIAEAETARIAVDLWALGRIGHLFQRPLIQALASTGAVDLRAIMSDADADLGAMQRLGLPMLVLPGAAKRADAVRLSWRLWGARRRLAAFQRGAKRIVHITMGSRWDNLYLSVAKRAGATILLSVHDATHHPGEESRLVQALADRAIRLSDHVAVLSRHVGETLSKQWPDKPVHLVPDGLILATREASAPRAFPQGRPLRLLFLGRIIFYKGLDILLGALALLERDGVPVELTIAGAGDIEPYRQQIESLRSVTLHHGWYSDAQKEAWLAGCDVNMLPYREASQSGIALDGLVAAMPSIATRINGLTEQLRDGEDALFADAPTAEAVAAQIRRLAADRVLYECLPKGTHPSATGGPARGAAQWAALYREIAPR